MKKVIINLIFMFCCFYNSEAQKQKPIYRMVANEVERKSTFETYDLFKQGLPSKEIERALADTFLGAITLDFNTEVALQLTREKAKTILLRIPTDIGVLEVSLVKINLFADGFTITASNNESVKNAIDKGVHYQGIVNGQNESIAAISIFTDEVIGTISTKNGNYVIGKIKGNNKLNQHVVYNDQRVSYKPKLGCDTKNIAADYKRNVLNADYAGLPPVRCVKIYVESAFNVYQGNGSSVNTTVNFLTGLFNQSAALYFNDGVYITLSQLFIWTSASPYDGCASSSACLNSFQITRPTFNGNIGHMVSLSNSNGGLAAGFNGLCNPDKKQSECYSGLLNTFSVVPTYSWSVMVFTHEMGHLLGSRHTHACVWNGTGTAIDGCSGFTEGGCPLPGNPAGGGTIMSYCHIASVGINFTLGFGSQPGNVIRNNVNTASCISVCNNDADLYIKDQPTDIGVEPNPDPTGVFWNSEDIWVRNTNDGFINQVHQNPEYRNPASMQPNYVYVRVRNRGFAASTGTEMLKLYWAKASSALSWPNPWNGSLPVSCNPAKFMGGQMNPIAGKPISPINAGGEQIFEFQWYPENPVDYVCLGPDEHHFCLLTRIEGTATAPFGMTTPETTDLWWNVKNNNNIAWRNLSVVDLIPGLPAKATTFFIGGSKFAGRKMKTTNLKFSVVPKENQRPLLKSYEVLISLGKISNKWRQYGSKGEGFKMVERGKEIFLVFTSDKASINNIPIDADEIQAVKILVAPKSGAKKLIGYTAKFNLIQTDENNNVIGGESFQLNAKDR